jgi:hypothetical protein
MLNQVLLTARLWMGQGPTFALRLLAEPIARRFQQPVNKNGCRPVHGVSSGGERIILVQRRLAAVFAASRKEDADWRSRSRADDGPVL